MTTQAHDDSKSTMLRTDCFPMRVYEKAKHVGVCTPWSGLPEHYSS